MAKTGTRRRSTVDPRPGLRGNDIVTPTPRCPCRALLSVASTGATARRPWARGGVPRYTTENRHKPGPSVDLSLIRRACQFSVRHWQRAAVQALVRRGASAFAPFRALRGRRWPGKVTVEPVQSPAARPCRGFPLPGHVCSARTPEGEPRHADTRSQRARYDGMMRVPIACENMNHRRVNAPVSHCPQCGRVVNPDLPARSCTDEQHAVSRRQGAMFCVACGTQLRKA